MSDPASSVQQRSLLASLDPEQVAAASAPRGPVCILAGAGTGKTRTITHRIAQLIATGQTAPNQVLAVTFTRRAAGEMRQRLRALGVPGAERVQARTFHSAAMRQLQYFWPRVVGNIEWRLVENEYQLIDRAARAIGAAAHRDEVRDYAAEIGWAKGTLITPEAYVASVAKLHREPPTDAGTMAAVYASYEELKRTSGDVMLLDYADLLLHTAGALENSVDVATEFREQYRTFVVDEYQDVTPLQQRVLDAWVGDRDDLTVVGDANQTIYSFGGATPEYLLGFSRRFPEATVVRLERDYRSTPQVVSLANRVIGGAQGRIAGARLRLVGQLGDGPEPQFDEYSDEPAEAQATASAIARLIAQGIPASEIAVLYRINAQSEAFETALSERGIAYQVRGGDGFFQRSEVRQGISSLRRLVGRADLPEVRGEQLVTVARAQFAELGLTEQAPSGEQARERWTGLNALVSLVGELAAVDPMLDLQGLQRELERRAADRHPPTVEGVTLSTLHAAKGLEWDAVFLVGLTDGNLPIAHVLRDGTDPDGIEEERRLLYVGVTRARRHLGLSWSLARNPGGKPNRHRSRFLSGIAPAEERLPDRAKPRGSRKRDTTCRVCGTRLTSSTAIMLGRCDSCASEVDEALLTALREWRSAKSKELKVPAYVVFSDNTLIAIAEQLPTDDAALVAIPGIGAKKLATFGEDVLDITRAASRG